MSYFELPGAPESVDMDKSRDTTYNGSINTILSKNRGNSSELVLFLEPEVLPEKGSIYPYWAFRIKNSSGTLKSNKVRLKLNGRNIQLPNNLGVQIQKTLKESSFLGLDCVRFMMKMTGRKELQQDDLEEIEPSTFYGEKLKPGEAISFMNSSGEIGHNGPNGLCFHFVTYIGNNLFIFKLGSVSNEFFISDLKNLKAGFLKDYPRMFLVK